MSDYMSFFEKMEKKLVLANQKRVFITWEIGFLGVSKVGPDSQFDVSTMFI